MSHHKRTHIWWSGVKVAATVMCLIAVMIGPSITAATASSFASVSQHSLQSSATLELTLRGCPEGVIPQNLNPAASCTEPLDAPGTANAIWSGGSAHVPSASRSWDGTYVITVPANVQVSLANFEPEVRDAFHAVGSDGTDQYGDPVITLAPGTTRHVGIYYYYASAAPIQATGTLSLTLRGCPEGIIPQNVNPAASCTIPLDAPDLATIWYGTGSVSMLQVDRDSNGTYHVSVPANMQTSLQGFEPAVRDDFHMVGVDGIGQHGHPVVKVAPGENRHIGVYYYYFTAGSSSSGNAESGIAPVTSNPGTSITTVEIASASVIGTPMMGVCYELIELGRSACLESGSDVVVFTDIPPGTYTAHQTEDLGDNYVTDFTFDVLGDTPVQRVGTTVVSPWGSPSRIGRFNEVGVIDYNFASWPGGTDNVTIVFMDASTGEIVLTNGCVQIVNVTGNGCDSQTGQINFVDVPVGPHEIEVTAVPNGYELALGMEHLPLDNPGGTPNGPMRVVYFIDIVPVGNAEAAASPVADDADAAPDVDVRLFTICASNRHGVDYPAMIFNLTPEVAVQAGFMIEDGQGNLVPEWQGVRLGECSYGSGFHLFENVADEASIVTYCQNGETRERSANQIGVSFIDPAQTGQALNPGAIFINWRTAPDGVYPGTCSQPVGRDGHKMFEEMIGTWEGTRRTVIINADGTGEVQYNLSNHRTYLRYKIVVEIGTFPVAATVVAMESGGDPDLSRFPGVGDTILLTLQPPSILVLELVPGWEMDLCLPGSDTHFHAGCY